MSSEENILQCYNRGCGQKFNPNNNTEDSCRHHPGEPFFHDAYKGWSCCNRKCIDFTEFLNIKGCKVSKHSNIKLPEPESKKDEIMEEVVQVKPIVHTRLERPPLETPMVVLKPDLAPSLKQQLKETNLEPEKKSEEIGPKEIAIGTLCKRSCNTSYAGPETDQTVCMYHSGSPIFHEGLKFWSCCLKKTTDFNAFLNQVGCKQGKHLWIKEETESTNIQCRWDFHQTGSFVVISIYAKNYCPKESIIKLNPIRLYVNLLFPKENNANFILDEELCGIVDVQLSVATMFGTKVEIKLKKAESGSWKKLEKSKTKKNTENEAQKKTDIDLDSVTPQVGAVDLSDI